MYLHSTPARAGCSPSTAPPAGSQCQRRQNPDPGVSSRLQAILDDLLANLSQEPTVAVTLHIPVSKWEDLSRQGAQQASQPSSFVPANRNYPAQHPSSVPQTPEVECIERTYAHEHRLVPTFFKANRRLPPPIPSRPMASSSHPPTQESWTRPNVPQEPSNTQNTNAIHSPPTIAPLPVPHPIPDVIDLTGDEEEEVRPNQTRTFGFVFENGGLVHNTSSQNIKKDKGKGKAREFTDCEEIRTGFACPYPSPHYPRLRCNVFFPERGVLDRHLGAHLKEEAAMRRRGGPGFDVESLVFGGLDAPGFQCQYCGSSYLRQDSLRRHQGLDGKKIVCPVLSGIETKQRGKRKQQIEWERKYALPGSEFHSGGAAHPPALGEGSGVDSTTEQRERRDDPDATDWEDDSSTDDSALEGLPDQDTIPQEHNNEPKVRYAWPSIRWVNTKGGCKVVAQVCQRPSTNCKTPKNKQQSSKSRKFDIVKVLEVKTRYSGR
ncbi:hypothetical protein DACRYDRAFT_17406 [Dacryopinax primogenitus]|uniref:C2H2-type domain-containing protein n=1 Tax=Dacryopinax primogenitus (strain DJM 731) TaxID=1858805 RepID=M5G063_DACPD|nr:uncharacterized protein DACRYDRAFT_17406 [Dacryopinax primogenitus]EJT99186.1 hypothetical protein DACRYDRAFT_17406 [Dacryopinax primogenitus]